MICEAFLIFHFFETVWQTPRRASLVRLQGLIVHEHEYPIEEYQIGRKTAKVKKRFP